jgi:FkbH-like protein
MSVRTLFHDTLPALLTGDAGAGADRLGQWVANHGPSTELHPLLRLAIYRTAQPFLYYLKLFNLWKRFGEPMLKPNPTRRKVLLLSDSTADNLVSLLRLLCAAFGVDLEIEVPPFDSVEQVAFAASDDADKSRLIVLSLSEHWLARYLGTAALVSRTALEQTREMLGPILASLQAGDPDHILITTFTPRAYAAPSGMVRVPDAVGWNLAVAELNVWLAEQQDSRTSVVDLAEGLFGAGGRTATGRVSYFRSKMAFEPAGMVAAAREIASAIVQLLGKSHRAIVTDWDNTLWGGEVAEVGSHGIVCGRDTPDGLAYSKVQQYLRGVTSTGVLLAGVSRNHPAVTRVFRENLDMVLREDDFASVRVGFGPKSVAIGEVARDLGFGTEFFVFLDDSLFELAEAVVAHPYLDVLPAGPEPEITLQRLSESRFCNAVSLSAEDLRRGEASCALRQQREFQTGFADLDSFLREIRIRVDVAGLTEANRSRVIQMFQKSNQFNLTTRRHGEAELRRLLAAGGTIGVFSYEDAFGPQGVISAATLVPENDAVRIESWLMSCRVLNRTVEQAVFAWIVEQAAGRNVVGEYLPTAKNGLVRGLFRSLGFELEAREAASGREVWRFASAGDRQLPIFHAQLRTAA